MKEGGDWDVGGKMWKAVMITALIVAGIWVIQDLLLRVG